jgi:hypothetical protein
MSRNRTSDGLLKLLLLSETTKMLMELDFVDVFYEKLG